ncbi:MAG: hypothetical protein V4585_22575 [Bacteroidota bacterium]
MKKEDIIYAFEHSNRNRYIKLFDYYEEWFINSDYLSIEISRKIKDDLDIQVSTNSIHYIRSKIMPKRLAERIEKRREPVFNPKIETTNYSTNENLNSESNFEFNEPKSIDHNQEIVTFRKSKI